MSFDTAHTKAEKGKAQIAWARRFMPLSAAAMRSLAVGNGTVKEAHIGIALPLDPATASLAQRLMGAGLEVSILAGSPADNAAHLLCALGEAGAHICTTREAFLQCGCDIVLSDKDDLLPQGISGAVLTGANPAEQPAVPAIDLSASPLLQMAFTHGIGQACVSGILDITNLQIAGSNVLVIGYGGAGQGVARYAQSFGARVIVSEQDPVRAVRAKLDGHDVQDVDAALPNAAVVFHASEAEPGLTLPQIGALPNGAFLCNATRNANAFPLAEIEASGPGKTIRDHVTQYDLASGTNVKLVCDGMAIHTGAGTGLPLEFVDLQVAALLHCIAKLTGSSCHLGPGLHALPANIEKDLARAIVLND